MEDADFQPLEWRHREEYDRRWAASSQSSSDHCFSILWGWEPYFGYQIRFDGPLAWIRQGDGALLAPVGPWDETDWTLALARAGRRGTLISVPEHLALELSDQLGCRVAIEEDRASHQYLYDKEALLDLSGNRQARRRHKINHFHKNWNSRFVPLDAGLVPDLIAFQNRWMEHQPASELLEAEHRCILRLFEKWRELNLSGGALFAGDALVGYTLAEDVPDGSLQVHVEKADDAYPGAYQALCNAFLETLPEGNRVINREEDMGNPGLRQAKLSYGPSRFLRQYRIKWDLDADEAHPVTFASPLPKEPTPERAVESDKREDSAPPPLPPLDREEVFAHFRCKTVAESFEARQRCAVWQAVERDLDKFLEDLAEDAFRVSDDLASHPEISGQEYRTSRILAKLLEESGFAVEYPWCGLDTAFIGRYTLGHGGPVVAFLAEYDALPGVGHGCGHNISGVVSLYAAMALRHALERNRQEATLWVIGTPSEETGGGKIHIAESGAVDQVTLALMFHCTTGKNRAFSRFLASDGYEFTFEGISAHAASQPWEGRNAQSAARLFMDAIDYARQTVPDGTRLSARLQDGVGAVNVIPDRATVQVQMRSPARRLLQPVVSRILKMARGCAMATDTTATWRRTSSGYDEMYPNWAAEELARRVMRCMELPLDEDPTPVASSDIGNLSHRCPAIHPCISISDEFIPIHSAAFAGATKTDAAHQALIRGAKAAARIAGRIAIDPDLARLIRQDFESPEEKN